MVIDATKSNDVGQNGISFEEDIIHITGGASAPTHTAPEGSRYFRADKTWYVQDGPGNTNNWILVVETDSSKKAGTVDGTTFSTVSNKKVFDIVFITNFPDTDYAINIDGEDQRIWTWSNKTVSGFRISSQSNSALSGFVSWSAIQNGE